MWSSERPYIDRVVPEHHLSFGMSAQATMARPIFTPVSRRAFDGFMISRFSAGAVLDLLIEFARQASH
jgi:hypothetical protein